MTDFLNGPTGFCGNHQGLGGTYYNKPTESIGFAIGATGHGSNTDQSGQAITINKPVANPTGATGHGSNTDQSGSVDTINPNTLEKPAKEKKAIPDLYMSDGDDYYIDDNALSNAQMRTGDDKKADSVVGSGGSDDLETNSNVNTGVFGGPARAAHPGYSLW